MNRTRLILNCLLSWLLLALCSHTSFGQGGSAPLMASYDTPANRLRIVPPNVASIERYGSVPVNFSSGQLNYSIPLHSIDVDNNLSLPIQLTYNNTGLKPDEIPSWVGNGWDLHVGGSIVQTIRSVDDFDPIAGLQVPSNRTQLQDFIAGTISLTDRYLYSNKVVNNQKDSQFDVFSFNLPGKTGKFYFDGANAVLYNKLPLRINFDKANNQFTITDERGTVYLFEVSLVGSESFSTTPFYAYSDPYSISCKTWYLSKITTSAGVEVNISYKSDVTYHLPTNNYSSSVRPGQTYTYGSQGTDVTVNQMIVDQISWKGKHIDFETIDRNDLYATNDAKAHALSKIKVYNESNVLVRQIGFDYDNGSRLQLQGLSILDRSTNNKVQSYVFDYYGSAGAIPIPYLRGSTITNPANNSIDHWGYYNGKSNTSKIPKGNYATVIPTLSQPFQTGDRSSDGSFSLAGMLKRITYPTKGYTEITYEPNTVSFPKQINVPFPMQSQDVASGYTMFFQADDSNCNQSQPVNGQFTVSQAIYGARVNWTLASNSANRGSGFVLAGPTGQILINDSSVPTKQDVTRLDLPAGTYSYTLVLGCQPPLAPAQPVSGTTVTPTSATSTTGAPALGAPASLPLAYFTIEKPTSGIISLAVGGNRVAKVIDYDQTKGYNERVIAYEQAVLRNELNYITSHLTGGSIGSENACISIGTTYVINERNIYGWDGFHVSYRQVTESLGANSTNGKQIYTFDDSYYVGQSFRQAPYPPAQNLTWRSDSPLEHYTYRKNQNGTFELVAKSSNTYTSATLTAPFNGVKIERNLACPDGTAANPNVDLGYFSWITVPVFSDHFGVENKVQEQWFGSNVVSASSAYGYNNDWLVNQVTTTNSKNQPEKVLTYYANDYENSASSHIGQLKTINAIGVPIKTIRTVNDLAVEGTLTRTDGVGNPIEVYRLDIAAPATFTHDRNTFMPAGFNLFQSRQYSSKGNITQLAPRNGPTRTYVWAYNHTYPIAEVLNATQTQVEGVSGVGSLESVATLTADASVGSIGSAIRSSLTQSLVTSTVLQSGVGIKQLTDPSGLNTTYVYDGINRLTTISNNKNEIVKEYAYNYRDPNASTGSGNDGNQPPSSTGTISDQLATLNQAYTYTVSGTLFSDPENQSLVYTVNGLPVGLSYANNLISGTPSALGQSLVTLTATDPGGLSSSISFFLTVGTCLIADPYIVTGTYSSSTPVSFNAVNRIETDAVQQVLVNPSASLTLKAGQSVRLKPGFIIKPGASFRAYTGPCN